MNLPPEYDPDYIRCPACGCWYAPSKGEDCICKDKYGGKDEPEKTDT